VQQPQHILVIRFSAMGDVAMTVPVIKNMLQQNPQVQVTVVSNAFLQPLFVGIERCHFYPAYLKAQHKGIAGIYRLFKELKAAGTFTAIADLHSVLRSSLLKNFFKLSGFKIATVHKGRKEKKQLTRKENKIFKPLTSTHERYASVFRKLGVAVTLNNHSPVFSKQVIPAAIQNLFSADKRVIGAAPFAQHEEKMYTPEKMKAVVQLLTAENNTVLLFGGGEKETALLQQWADEMKGVHNIAGKFSFTDELAIISNISLMVSMDSANMHLASLFGVPVVSVWGATHWYAGFNGWGQDVKNIVQADLYCRPCSVFGNKPCYRGDHACMHLITPQMIAGKVSPGNG
jgi:ADP-heptose:LPS heptosyltransferase